MGADIKMQLDRSVKIGPVTDLNGYRGYIPRFSECLGRPSYCAEIHLLHRDFTGDVDGAFHAAGRFFKQQALEEVAFHTLDDVLNDVILFELSDCYSVYERFRPSADRVKIYDKFERQFEMIRRAGEGFGRAVNAVIHQGIFLPSADLAAIGDDGVGELRDRFLEKIADIHDIHFAPHGRDINLMLENSPPFRGMSVDEQHFIDQLVADIGPRLRPGERAVMDVAHTMMDYHYFMSGEAGVFGLDLARARHSEHGRHDNGYESLATFSGQIGWIHLNDCTGIYGRNEGLAIRQSDTIVDWDRMVALLKKIDAPMILEVRDAEKDFGLLERSLESFGEMWDGSEVEG